MQEQGSCRSRRSVRSLAMDLLLLHLAQNGKGARDNHEINGILLRQGEKCSHFKAITEAMLHGIVAFSNFVAKSRARRS